MRSDDSFGQPFDGEVLETDFSIGLAGRMHDHEISRVARPPK